MILATLAAVLVPQTFQPPENAAPQKPDPAASAVAELSPEAAPASKEAAKTTGAETLELGANRSVTGRILKETADAVFVDLGFDVLRVPLASIVRRVSLEAATQGEVTDEGVFFTAVRPEKSIQEGSSEVGPAVVKIESPSGQGSGFIVNQAGLIVTNFHVVEGEVDVAVKLFLRTEDGLEQRTLRKCKVVAANPDADLALVKIEPPEDIVLPYVYMGDSESVAVGERVYAIGTPIGLERTVSSGIVSVNNRAFSGRTHLQITTPINPGNSGGPLFNLRGEVVGVNSSGYTGLQGLNFAIPSKYVIDFLRNRDAFAVDTTRSENGIHYLPAPRKPDAEPSRGK